MIESDIFGLIKIPDTNTFTNLFSWLITTSEEGLNTIRYLIQHNTNLLKNLTFGFLHPKITPAPNITLLSMAKNEHGRYILAQIAVRKPAQFINITPSIFYDEDENGHSVFSLLCEPDSTATLECIFMHNEELIKNFSADYILSLDRKQNIVYDPQLSDEMSMKTSLLHLIQSEAGCRIILLLYTQSTCFQDQIIKHKLIPVLRIAFKQSKHGQSSLKKLQKEFNLTKQSNNPSRLFQPASSENKEITENEKECVIF